MERTPNAEVAAPERLPGDRRDRIAREGLVSMLRAGLETEEQRRAWLPAAGLLLLAWAGFVGVSGAHLGSGWGEPVFGLLPRPALFAVALAVLAASAAVLARRAARPLSILSLMLTAYLAGNLLSGGAHRLLDPAELLAGAPAGLHFVASRLLYAASVALPMVLVYRFAYRAAGEFHFGLGLRGWSAPTRLGKGDRPRSWTAILLGFAVFVAGPIFLLMQLQVDLAPMVSGRLTGLFHWIVAMALANAFAEELVFRGFLQGASVQVLGPARGIWAVGLLFGLHHAGASFEPLASLPAALLIGVGSVLFAKSVLETRGLAWAVSAHALVNVGLFSAFYIAA